MPSEIHSRDYFAEYAEALDTTTAHIITVIVPYESATLAAVYFADEDFLGDLDDDAVRELAERTPVRIALTQRGGDGIIRVKSTGILHDTTVATLAQHLAEMSP